jgi:hypothetical protein
MERKVGQRVNVHFCVKLQKVPSETLEMSRIVYGASPNQRSQGCTVQKQNNADLLSRLKEHHPLWIGPEGATVNQTFYMEVLKRLIDAVRRKPGELWRDRSLILRHDNAPAYSSLRVSQSLAGKCISAKDYPPYSPDSAPAHFWLFPNSGVCWKESVSRTLRILNYLQKNFERQSCSGF